MEKFQKIFKIQWGKHNVGRCRLKIAVTEYGLRHFNENINKKQWILTDIFPRQIT